jgi:hypothetical protein
MSTLLIVALLLLTVGRAHAQEQYAAIEGVVRDTQGGVVPGVVVVAHSAGGLLAEALTDDSGTYRFASLPPNRYDLTATFAGFTPARITNIDLLLGLRLSIDVVLAPAGLDDTVVVVGSAPLVAVTQSSRAVSIRGDAIEKMPRGRDFTSLALQAPGANNESKLAGVSIDGSSGAENRVLIDGVETTDTWVGTPGQFLVTDFVEELQVKSSGYTAEYGGSTGGVLNAITKSGTNTWQGDALFYWSDDALDAAPRPTLQIVPTDIGRAEYVTYPEDRYRQLEMGVTLGGPILRDHAWVFGGYVPSFRPLDRTVTFRADGSSGSYRQDLTRHNAAINVLAQPGKQWRVRGTFTSGSQHQGGLLPALDGTSNPAANYSIDEVRPNHSTSVGVNMTPSSRVLLSVRAGYFFRDLYNQGVYRGDRVQYLSSSVGMPGVPPAYQQPVGYANVPSNIGRDKGKGPHFSTQLDGTAFVSGLGQHQVKAGLQLDRVGLDALAGGTGNGIIVAWDLSFMGTRGPFGYYRVMSNDREPNLGVITQGNATVNNVGLFVQDAWTMGRFAIHAGLRTENERVPSLSPDPQVPGTAIRFGFDDKLAPRLGFAWDVVGDGKTKVYGSWGVFYDITKLQLSFAFGGFSSVGYWYTLDSGDIGAIIDNQACPPACPGRFIARSETATLLNNPADSHIDPGLDQTRLQEAVAGIEREIAPDLSIGVRYIHKQIDRAVEDVGTRDAGQLGTTVRIANPGFGQASAFYPELGTVPIAFPRARRDYDAVEVALDRRLSRGWSSRVSYTWSRLVGNYSGLAQSDEDGRVAPNTGRNFDSPMIAFDERGEPVYGVLATDRPHQLEANLVLDTRHGASVGTRWFGASGLPKTREAAFLSSLNQVPVMYRGRRSDGRLPFVTQLDLYLQQQIAVVGRARLTVSANVINAFNQGAAVNYFPAELFPGQAIAVDERTFYQGVDTQALIAAQRLVRDPRFLLDSGFQPPRTLRFGAKLSF